MSLVSACRCVHVYMYVCVCVRVHTRIPLLCRFKEDKRRAERGGWRIPEKELFFFGLIGGAIGGFVAMLEFNHKTAKLQFCLPYTVLLIANLAVVFVIVVSPYIVQ